MVQKQKFDEGGTENITLGIGFEDDRISLDVSEGGLTVDGCWKITPLQQPTVSTLK